MRVLLLALMLASGWTTVSFAGPCDHSYQQARDGSSCGDRAADRRNGGR